MILWENTSADTRWTGRKSDWQNHIGNSWPYFTWNRTDYSCSCFGNVFPGLEIRQSQHRVIQDGKEVNLTRLEYSTLVFLASNPGIVLTQTQIFEAVWNMDSDSCHSSVVNVICNLRKKIEPDSKNPVYIKTVLGVGYKFNG